MVIEVKKKVDIDIEDIAYKVISEGLDDQLNSYLEVYNCDIDDLENDVLIDTEVKILEFALEAVKKRVDNNYEKEAE